MYRKPFAILVSAALLFSCAKTPQEIPDPLVSVTSVNLDKTELTLVEGDKGKLLATVRPDNAADKTVVWKSSDQAVVLVSSEGEVYAIKEGSATVTASAGDKSASCKVAVEKKVIPVTSVTLDKTELTLVEGEEETLVATVKPENATDKSVTWESSEAKVASVNNEGKVSAIAEGSATITVKSGEVSATCQVKVNAKQMEITGLESLKSVTFKVDEPVDLVQGLSVTRDGTIAKILVAEDGRETELESHVYVPEFPVENLSFTFFAETPDGKQTATATVEGLSVHPLEYNQLALTPTNIGKNWDEWKKTNVNTGNGGSHWYEYYETVGLLQTKKVLEQLDLMAPEGRKEKLEHIKIVGCGERPSGNSPWIEGVWESIPPKEGWDHADILTEKIKTADNAPNRGIAQSYPGKILWVGSLWAKRLQLLSENPDTRYIFFTACDWVGGVGEYNPKGTSEGNALEELVNSPNSFIIASIGNVDQLRDFGLECNQSWIERGQYGTSSIQGKHSFAAIGGHLSETKFWDYDIYPYEHSVFPIGFEQKNLKISSGGYAYHEGDRFVAQYRDDAATASSWPAGELAATMWNIMALDPDMSFDDLMDLINTYKILIPASHNGVKIQDFDTPDQKEICRQICLPDIPEGLASDNNTDLPRNSKYPAVLWTGPGVEYCINGQWKSMTADNLQDGRDIYEAAANATFRFNSILWKKQGGKGTVNLKVMAITTDGETIPEVEMEVSFNL